MLMLLRIDSGSAVCRLSQSKADTVRRGWTLVGKIDPWSRFDHLLLVASLLLLVRHLLLEAMHLFLVASTYFFPCRQD